MQQNRITYMLGFCNNDKRREIQRKAAQFWLDKQHRVIVLDSQHTEQEFYEFMQSDVEYIHMSDLTRFVVLETLLLKMLLEKVITTN